MKKLTIYSACYLLSLASLAFAQEEDEVMTLLRELAADMRNQIDESQSGWIIINSNHDHSRYFFTSSLSDPAHPAVFKHKIYESDGAIHMDLSDTCKGDEEACAKYREYFENMRRQLRSQFQPKEQE